MRGLIVLSGKHIKIDNYVQGADKIICADGGADILIKEGYMPDVLLGDMDSISDTAMKKCEQSGVEIVKYPIKKDMTDGQLAILYCMHHSIDNVDIVCVEGNADHYLGNIYLLIFAKRYNIKARIITEDEIVYVVDDSIKISGKAGSKVSILPADGEIIVKKAEGLYYKIDKKLKISFGDTIGLRNHMTGNSAEITIQKGTAFVIVEKE